MLYSPDIQDELRRQANLLSMNISLEMTFNSFGSSDFKLLSSYPKLQDALINGSQFNKRNPDFDLYIPYQSQYTILFSFTTLILRSRLESRPDWEELKNTLSQQNSNQGLFWSAINQIENPQVLEELSKIITEVCPDLIITNPLEDIKKVTIDDFAKAIVNDRVTM